MSRFPVTLLFTALLSCTRREEPRPAATGPAALSRNRAHQVVSIPGATFAMGSGRAPDEPTHRVTLSPYRIDAQEVDIASFERFVQEGWSRDDYWSTEGLAWRDAHPEGAGARARASGRSGDHPVVAVTWYEAAAYCRALGGRLPTEAEWEYAACGGGTSRYPWGDEEPGSSVIHPGAPSTDARSLDGPVWYNEGKYGMVPGVATRPVTEQEPRFSSPFGLVHVIGNAWEWTQDGYHRDGYRTTSPTDPANLAATPWKVLRGGSFENLPSYCTCTHREPARPGQPRLTAGFRCAYGATP